MNSIKDRYRRFLNTIKGAHIYNDFKRILYSEDDSLVQTLDTDLLQDLEVIQKEELDVCDIGGGDGDRIVRILTYLHAKFRNRFRLDFVEQSRPFVETFDTTRVDTFTTTTLFHGLFEEVALPRQYDLVFLIHSIFAFEKENAIEKVLSLGRPGGRIIIVSNSRGSFLAGLKALVDEGYDDTRYEIHDVCRELTDRRVDYQNFSFDTKWAIEEETYDHDVRIMLDWLSLGTFSSFSTEKRAAVQNYIADNTFKSNGRIFFTENEAVIVIPIPAQRPA